MRTYLEGNPILWVKSSVLLDFIDRRMVELKNLQLMLFKSPPTNYKTLTCLIMHLIQCIPTNPSPRYGFLRDALVQIRFSSVMHRFGAFFLHGLNVDIGTIEEVDLKDSREAQNAIKVVVRRKNLIQMPNTCPTLEYPLGKSPAWSQIVETFASNPQLLIKDWIWDEIWNHHTLASKLFIQFTVDIWLAVNPNFLCQPLPHPDTMEEAMATWAVASLTDVFTHCIFQPSNYGLTGASIRGRPGKGFKEMVDTFFPTEEVTRTYKKKSVWTPFVSTGYIKDYHIVCLKIGNNGREELHKALVHIFEGLQCLPMSLQASQKNGGKIWNSIRGSVRFITNPVYYCLDSIGANKKAASKAIKVKATAAVIESRLREEHHGVPTKVTTRQQRETRRAEKRAKAVKERKQASRINKSKISQILEDDSDTSVQFSDSRRLG
jgi:hypothetical protein